MLLRLIEAETQVGKLNNEDMEKDLGVYFTTRGCTVYFKIFIERDINESLFFRSERL